MRFVISIQALAIALTPLSYAQEDAWFEGVGDLPGGNYSSTAYGISGDGATVVGVSHVSNNHEAFSWTRSGGIASIGTLTGDDSTAAYRPNWDGSVIVGQSQSGINPYPFQAFVWTANEGMRGLGFLPGMSWSIAYSVSDDGLIVVGFSSTWWDDRQAFQWTASEGMVALGDLPGGTLYSVASRISGDGRAIIGTSDGSAGDEAFRWTETTGMVGLSDLPGGGFDSGALGVNNDGSIIVGQGTSEEGQEAFRWTEELGMVGLGDVPGNSFSSNAYDVSDDGSIIVGYGDGEAQHDDAMIWDPWSGMRNLRQVLIQDYGLDLTGWRLSTAYAVSDDGRTIAGGGGNPAGQGEGFVAHLGPLPTFPRLTDFHVSFGTFLRGELTDLMESDNERVEMRSRFGFSALEPNVMEMRIGAISVHAKPDLIDVRIEGKLSQPGGTTRVRLRNWSTNQFQQVHQYPIGTEEIIEDAKDIDAANFIRASDGRIEISIRQSVAVTFSTFGCVSKTDQVLIRVR